MDVGAGNASSNASSTRGSVDGRGTTTDLKAALIDLDGTVYRGDQLLPGADDGITALEMAGVETIFLSNNATKRPFEYRQKLSSLGIDVPLERILNSAAVSADYIATTHPNASVYVLGEPSLVAELEDAGVTVTSNPAEIDIVLASMDRSFDYENLVDVLEGDAHGEPILYATNPDRTCPVEDGEIPDCGAVIGAIEGMLGRTFDRVLGKPSNVIIDVALDRVGVDPEECLMIGDRLETDIRMGEGTGLRTALVCSGVTDRSELNDADATPDYVLDSLAEIGEILED